MEPARVRPVARLPVRRARPASGNQAFPAEPSVRLSLTGALGTFIDGGRRFLAANLVWAVAASLTALGGAIYPPAYLLGLLLVPASCGVLRMAGHAARDQPAQLAHFRDGMRHRWLRHLALGAGQALLLGVAVVNVGIAVRGEGLLPAMAAVVSGYVMLVTWVVATAAWPLLLDPRRHAMTWTTTLRVAVAVVMTRPLRLTIIAAIEAALITVTVQIAVLGLLLPTYGALVTAHCVLPIADRLQGSSRHRKP